MFPRQPVVVAPRAPRQAAGDADARLARDRGHGRRGCRYLGGIDRLSRLRPRQRDRGPCQRHRHLALHRNPDNFGERRAPRAKWVGVSFFLLAPCVASEAIETLIEGAAAENSWLGIALTAGTLMLCSWLGRARLRIGEKLGSRATYGEGTQNVLCAILAAAVLGRPLGEHLGWSAVA